MRGSKLYNIYIYIYIYISRLKWSERDSPSTNFVPCLLHHFGPELVFGRAEAEEDHRDRHSRYGTGSASGTTKEAAVGEGDADDLD